MESLFVLIMALSSIVHMLSRLLTFNSTCAQTRAIAFVARHRYKQDIDKQNTKSLRVCGWVVLNVVFWVNLPIT